jgi:hypothetical protein
VAAVCFKVLVLPEGTGEDHEKPQSVFRPGFETGTSRIEIRRFASSASLLGGENNIKIYLKLGMEVLYRMNCIRIRLNDRLLR